jgi:hypothetical protein
VVSKHLHQHKFQRQFAIFVQLFIQIQFLKANMFIWHVELFPATTGNAAYHFFHAGAITAEPSGVCDCITIYASEIT